jgi:AcrR family transcriptional regulator
MEPADPTLQLPLADSVCERADAARNRARILEAAKRLFTRDGVASTSMEAIAYEAGVGKGTVFRRFGDRASLALALLESSERHFQESLLRGEPPLGPGAPAAERVLAFGRALLAHFYAHNDLMGVAQAGGRFLDGPYRAYRLHLSILLREAAPELDADYLADGLLAPINPSLLARQLERGMELERLQEGWATLARGLFAPVPEPS